MNPSEAAMVLGVASSYDRRTVGEADAQAWAAALHDVRWEDGRDAIVAHYRETREWIMPADILRRVRIVRRERLVGITPPTPPPALADDPRAEQAWTRAVRAALGDGMDEAEAVATVTARMGLPPPEPARMVGPPPGARAALARMTDTTRIGDDE